MALSDFEKHKKIAYWYYNVLTKKMGYPDNPVRNWLYAQNVMNYFKNPDREINEDYEIFKELFNEK